MSSITTWTRIEPRARAGDMRPALEAQVHDPLWTLARQWQFGEFLGDDAGSPVWVRVRATSDRVTRFRPGADPVAEDYDGATPLEVLVEREEPAPDLRAAAEAGQHFLRMLAAAGLTGAVADTIVAAYPLRADEAPVGPLVDASARRYLAVVSGRVPDGAALADALGATLPDGMPEWGLQGADAETARQVAVRWLAWAKSRLSTVPPERSAWKPARMEYEFAVGADRGGQQVTLGAPAYDGGRLDWHSFVVDDKATPLQAPADRTELVRTVLPAPAFFAGMPSRRYWEFEDARVNFGGIETAPEDLARMLLVEFATVYANDWYVVPVDVPVGSLTSVTSVVVADTFGEQCLVPGQGDGRGDAGWSLFQLSASGGGAAESGLFVAPVLAQTLESEPLEEVAFARDEGANQAWAIERKVTNAVGRTLDRAEAAAARTFDGTGGTAVVGGDGTDPARLHYRLMTDVPEHWIPLLPVEVRPGANHLRRVTLSRTGRDGQPVPLNPLGRLLRPGEPLELPEEEVPSEGAVVTRTTQYARWVGGESFFWVGRGKRAGRGQSSSGLRFDTIG